MSSSNLLERIQNLDTGRAQNRPVQGQLTVKRHVNYQFENPFGTKEYISRRLAIYIWNVPEFHCTIIFICSYPYLI